MSWRAFTLGVAPVLVLSSLSVATAMTFHLADLPEHGLTLISLNRVDAPVLVQNAVGATVPAALVSALPFSVLVRSQAKAPLVAYAILWSQRTPSGTITRFVHRVSNLPLATVSPVLSAGETAFMSLAALPPLGAVTPRNIEDLQSRLRIFNRQSDITISLDVAVFDDGTAVGPDTLLESAAFRATIDAEKTTLQAIVSNSAQGHSVLDTLSRLTLDAKRSPIGSPESTNYSDKYAFHFRERQENEIMYLSRLNDRNGPDFVLNYAKRLLSTKRWMSIHK